MWRTTRCSGRRRHRPSDRRAAEADEATVDSVLGDADEVTRFGYRWLLLDNLVHELNALRGVLGEPIEVVYAELARECVAVNLRFGETTCHLSWVDLCRYRPVQAGVRVLLAGPATDPRAALTVPAQQAEPAVRRGRRAGTSHSWVREEVVSYDEAFRRELDEFADCIATGRAPRTSGSRWSRRPAAL